MRVHLADVRDEWRAGQHHDAEVARQVPHFASKARAERFAEPSMDSAEDDGGEEDGERQQQERGAGRQCGAPCLARGLAWRRRRSLVWQHAPRVPDAAVLLLHVGARGVDGVAEVDLAVRLDSERVA